MPQGVPISTAKMQVARSHLCSSDFRFTMKGIAILTILLVAVVQLLVVGSAEAGRSARAIKIHWPSLQARNKTKSERSVLFQLYTRNTRENPEVVDSEEMRTFSTMRKGRPWKMIIHGWHGHGDCRFSKQVRQAYLENEDINLIVVDWSGFQSRNPIYPVARSNVNAVAAVVARFLDFLASSGTISLPKLHVLGHSLGAHIAGVTGYLVEKGKIGRITGLDPAAPQFSFAKKLERLSPESALFVDVIHTTAKTLGFGDPIGHVDFYPNGGQAIQPGCGADVIGLCSHSRSYHIFLDSLKNPTGFPAVSCADWKQFEKKECSSNMIYMGKNTPTTARGVFYLQTKNESPFWKGKEGTVAE